LLVVVVAGTNGAFQVAAGAGGLRSTVTASGGGGSLESTIFTAQAYTVTVGAGGQVLVQPTSEQW
jgi:hypothetical protein